MPQDLLDHVSTQAAAAFGGNESRYIQALVRSDKTGSFNAMKRVIRMAAMAEDIAAELELDATAPIDAESNSVDLVITKLRLGLEFKARFRESSNEQGMVEAITFSLARRHCDEVWIILADEIPPDEGARFRALASQFSSGKVRAIPMADLDAELRRRVKLG